MKLSEIIAYINLLDQTSIDIECNEAVRKIDAMLHIVTQHPNQIRDFSNQLSQDFDSVNQSIKGFRETLADLRQELQLAVSAQEPEYFRESQAVFDPATLVEPIEYILNRRLGIDDQSNILLRSHLRNCSDWRLPGMIIRPGQETFIEDLVPLDPLYLVDTHEDLLTPSVSQFTPEYQRRLRQYVIDDRGAGDFMQELPNNQFGLIFAYNFFNYKPMDLIKRYLDSLFIKLRPGGVLIMTYNNCDRAQGVGLVEHCFMSYVPQNHLVAYAESKGFELSFTHDGKGDLSWVEFRRPGSITSLRGGQTLAKIVARSK